MPPFTFFHFDTQGNASNGQRAHHGQRVLRQWLESLGAAAYPAPNESLFRVERSPGVNMQALVDALLQESAWGEAVRQHLHSTAVYVLPNGHHPPTVWFDDMLTDAEWTQAKAARRVDRRSVVAHWVDEGTILDDVASRIAHFI